MVWYLCDAATTPVHLGKKLVQKKNNPKTKLGVDWNWASLGLISKWFIVFFLCYSFVRWVTLDVLNFLRPVSFPLYRRKSTYQRQDIHLYRSILMITPRNHHFSCDPVCSYHPVYHTACYIIILAGLYTISLHFSIGSSLIFLLSYWNEVWNLIVPIRANQHVTV